MNSPGISKKFSRVLQREFWLANVNRTAQARAFEGVKYLDLVFTKREIPLMAQLDDHAVKLVGAVKTVFTDADIVTVQPIEESIFRSYYDRKVIRYAQRQTDFFTDPEQEQVASEADSLQEPETQTAQAVRLQPTGSSPNRQG